MESKLSQHKIILSCDQNKQVKQVHLDSGSFLENIRLPVAFQSLVSSWSDEAFENFWQSIHENTMVESIVISLDLKDQPIRFIFSAYLIQDTVLLCGSTEWTTTEKVKQIRLVENKVDPKLREAKDMEINEAFLNEFSSLNNELINNKRELMRKNQKIELLNRELITVNENLARFTYSISHDLKEPLRMVYSFLSRFHEKYHESLDDKGKTYISMAMDGAKRLQSMLKELLEYHQTSHLGTQESVDLNEVLLEVMKILPKEIEDKSAQVSSDHLPTITGSFAAFRQVFQNLLSNAIKFVPKGKSPVVSIHVEEQADRFIFAIRDNGIGIAENQKQHVFDLFKRLNTPQEYEGTGMGLAIVKKSIERMGGAIWLESEPGKGSTFYFSVIKSSC